MNKNNNKVTFWFYMKRVFLLLKKKRERAFLTYFTFGHTFLFIYSSTKNYSTVTRKKKEKLFLTCFTFGHTNFSFFKQLELYMKLEIQNFYDNSSSYY